MRDAPNKSVFGLKTNELKTIVVIVLSIWLVFVADWFLPLEQLGLRPRRLSGLAGIVAMPLLHQGLAHIVSNTVPLVILLGLLALSRDDTIATVASIVLVGGVLLWVFGRDAIHVGASGLIFGLAAYLIVAGYRARTLAALAIAVVTLSLYGGSLLGGILPLQPGVSWDGHLSGLVAGAAVASLGPAGAVAGR